VCDFNADTLAYNPSVLQGSTTEADVMATVNAWIALAQVLYDSAWEVRWTGLYRVAAGVPERLPMPGAFSHDGTGSVATEGAQYFVSTNFQFDTVGKNNGRVRFLGIGGQNIGSEDFVTDSAGGSAAMNDIVGYLVGPATAVRAHDGTNLVGAAHMTTDVANRRRRDSIRI
jgi:hypothetical protein